MRKQFHVPEELLASWLRLSLRYCDYLPEMQMDRDSFFATPAEAVAIFRELKEMALPNRLEDCNCKFAGSVAT